MEVIKLDIQEEILEVDKNRSVYYFYKLCEDDYHLVDDKPDEKLRIETVEYLLYRFYDPYYKTNIINYLIQPKQKQLIDRIVKIEKDLLNAKIFEEKNSAITDENNRIKNLPWWMRLFNKF